MINKSSKLQLIPAAVVMVCVFGITLFDIRGSIRLIAILGFIAVFMFQSIGTKIALLFYISAFTADLGVSFGIPAISVMQLICILHFLNSKELKIEGSFIICALVILSSQMYSLFACGQSIKNIIVFLVNFFLMYLVFIEFTEADEYQYRTTLLFYILGVIAAVIAGLYRRGPNVDYWIRFRGIWTDPNFLGMFCILACCAVFSLAKGKVKNWIVYLPVLFLMIYAGYLTQSRTFIYVCAAVVAFYVISVLRSTTDSIEKKIAIVAVVLLAAIFIYNVFLVNIVEQRGITSGINGQDWSNGRFSLTAENFEFWSLNLFNMLFGYGIDNSLNYTTHVSHNTYADLLFELGIVGVVAIIVFFAAHIKQINWKEEKSFLVIIALYAATLSMQSTDLLYLFLGLLSFQSQTKLTGEKLNRRGLDG